MWWTMPTNLHGTLPCQQLATSLKPSPTRGSLVERGTPWVPRRQRGNLCLIRERGTHHLFTRPEDPGEQSGCGQKQATRPFPPLLESIHISTAIINGVGSQDERGRHYKFTTLTALNSHYFTSATHLSLHPGSSKGPQRGRARKPPTTGRSISITPRQKTVAICISSTYTAGGQQDVVWKLINAWISRHPGERVILIGDMNGFIPGGRHNHTHPMEKSLAEADDRLAKFCAKSKGTTSSPANLTWKRGEKQAKLNHGISWNFPLTSPRAVSNDTAHQKFDNTIISFGLPAEEFSRKPQPARKPLAQTDRVDAVFFQTHIRA